MRTGVATVLAEVTRLAPELHTAGTFSPATLEAIVRHASLQPVTHSVETGSGASTLLFSHLSEAHTVFALDAGTGSVRAVQRSPLLKPGVVTFVEGPTQRTLPVHTFTHRLQLALIDGPHGYPFPDLEYYCLYPHLENGALLIVDDIHIPTITNLFEFLAVDEMFELQEVVGTTAFFRRTEAQTFDATGDGWWLQKYNRRAFEPVLAEPLGNEPPMAQGAPTPFFVERFGLNENPTGLDVVHVAAHEDLIISGWALDGVEKRPASAVDFVLDDQAYRANLNVARGDVATAFGCHDYFRCGFNARLPAAILSSGSHRLEIRIVTQRGRECFSAMTIPFRVE